MHSKLVLLGVIDRSDAYSDLKENIQLYSYMQKKIPSGVG